MGGKDRWLAVGKDRAESRGGHSDQATHKKRGRRSAGFTANLLAIQGPSIAARAGDLQQQGMSPAKAWQQWASETIDGFKSMPATLLDSSALIADRLSAGFMLNGMGLRAAGLAAGKAFRPAPPIDSRLPNKPLRRAGRSPDPR
jgi:hypothetical protein